MTPILALAAFALAADKPAAVTLSGLSAVPPAEWKAEKPDNLLRSHQFKLPSGDEGFADAEVNVSPKASDDVEKYFGRWKDQYTPPDGKTADDVTKISELTVGGAKVHILDVTGTWKYKERPFDPRSKLQTLPEYRTVWVIVVGKEDTTHIRMSGPQGVVGKYYPGFEKWLKALK